MTKCLTNLRLKLDAKLLSLMALTSSFIAMHNPVTVLADDDFSWLENAPEDGGIFGDVTNTVKDVGASAYQLVLAVGVIGLLFSIIGIAWSLFVNKHNAQKKEENKSAIVYVFIGGVLLFGAMSVLGLFKTMGSSLKF